MNQLNSIIEAQISLHTTAATELKAQIAELQAQLDWHTAEAARHQESITPALEVIKLVELAPEKKIVWVNNEDGAELHSPNCRDLAKYRKNPFTEISSVEEWRSPEDFFSDYNSDFYAEGGNDACWNVTAFPCTGWKKTTVTEMPA
ncbi:hypothetical protein SEA_LUCKYBARNES_61 [Brevibacterium phage LuckyBarnes]|uniref:Uncharacterized protein n=1 Tax=Brevibacterium phage LuckyBarnes TaxID=2027888 RepID=A0A249XNR8_9CAUD|nr:hypothetical protein HOS02_gp61 [Brevibacterium phage LuckyBarnes]ASZ73378.1 hypothetical protein SEA_LUCKYBARNES_61 [Brevibacterium phage LuckyBarnes]